MTLNDKQFEFSHFLGLLILFAYVRGYTIAIGDVWSKPEYNAHIKNSLHYKKLAADILLFKDKKYLKKTEDYKELGTFWESLHPNNRWGGRFQDGNHFEYVPNGWR